MNKTPQLFEPNCLATTIGSMPHVDIKRGTDLMFKSTPEIPAWVQFPRLNFYENMMIQFTEGIPGLVERDKKIHFDTSAPSFTDELTTFFSHFLAVTEAGDKEALEHFKLTPHYAAGFHEFIKGLPEQPFSPVMLKGQVTGPFTLGINLTDQNGRPAYYEGQLRDVVVKSVTLKAHWQIEQMKQFDLPIIIFLDEPSLLGYGSHLYITVSREDIINDLNEVAAAIHAEGALVGVHCEADTDWSILMGSELDILVFDAYDHMQAMTLFPEELHSFSKGEEAWAGELSPLLTVMQRQ